MSIEAYRGYVIEGLARPVGDGMYESHGIVQSGGQGGPHFSVASEDLGCYATSQEAQDHAILWAQRYIDKLLISLGQ
ncbi:hypothetical protein OR16_04122 [Cupriavidus basilensis OR16]|uniref:Uncharacterized protein n=1 Tax=Cupriavidus basilensis OR16 TaxID=1127483 RepID=H1RZS1_9BURK|nr:hypothetical protein OR16_04122 [Cupriavidus basilensis OR16]